MLLMWTIYVISFLFLLCFHARLFIVALWSPVGKRLTSWLSFVMSNCEVVTFPLVSWVRCVAWFIDSWSLYSFNFLNLNTNSSVKFWSNVFLYGSMFNYSEYMTMKVFDHTDIHVEPKIKRQIVLNSCLTACNSFHSFFMNGIYI